LTTTLDHSPVSFLTAEQLVEHGQRVEAGGLIDMGINLLGRRDVGMPEDDLSIAGLDLVGLGYDDQIMTGFASMAHGQDEAEGNIARLISGGKG
jgi:hypothetical protein